MSMYLEHTCADVTYEEWQRLMRGARPLSYDWLRGRLRRQIPSLYKALALDYPNPYAEQCKTTRTHYILVHSAIEYFIRKQ
jgi:hypothetical protein